MSRLLRLALLLPLVALPGCDDPVEPEEPELVKLGVGLAAVGLEQVRVSLDGFPEAVLDPGMSVTREVLPGPHTLVFEWEGGTRTLEVDAEEKRDYAAVLMGLDDPEVRLVDHPRFSELRLSLLNAVPGDPLSVRVSGSGTVVVDLAYREFWRGGVGGDEADVYTSLTGVPDRPAGTVQLRTRATFIVLVPQTDGGQPRVMSM